LLTPIAVQRASDGKIYSDQAKDGLMAWGGAKNEVVILNLDRFSEKPTGYVLPLDEVSSLWGKSWREIGIDAFANHRTQGVPVFLGSPFSSQTKLPLKREDGGVLSPELLCKNFQQFSTPPLAPNIRIGANDCPRQISLCRRLMTRPLRLDWKECAT